ncbi:MAG: phospholipase D-like domain-containing protein [Xanthomonadales bacterium]|nr:phospholipase D-like domain-containing protein [Xanthomonadales bacterium]
MRALPAILLLLAACAPGPRLVERALRQAEALRSAEIEAAPAVPSPLLTVAAADPLTPRALPVERGEEALLLRLHLIRAARQSIELQSYIFAADEAGRLILAELLAAARRGVRVRVLADQLFSLPDTALLAGLAAAHVGFDLRLHNPTFRRARTSAPEFAAGILCCFRSFNQRMHNKLLLIDGRLALLGGRNVQNRYFDWDPDYDFRDREVLVAGPAVAAMRESFESFWSDRGSHAVARLGGVAERLARGPPPALTLALAEPWASRALWLRAQADDPVPDRPALPAPLPRRGADALLLGPARQGLAARSRGAGLHRRAEGDHRRRRARDRAADALPAS